jgi:hypothetical protein
LSLFCKATLLARAQNKATWLADDKRWRHHQPITFTFCLFARKISPN